MKEIDSDGLLLAKLQAETFSSSLKLNCSSEVFIRRFMNSKIAYELDLKIYLERIITAEEIINEITDEYGEFNYGKTKFNSEVLYWIGYFYRYFSYTYNLSSKEVYKMIKPKELNERYYIYHTYDLSYAIERILDEKEISLDPNKINEKLYEIIKNNYYKENIILKPNEDNTLNVIYKDSIIGKIYLNISDDYVMIKLDLIDEYKEKGIDVMIINKIINYIKDTYKVKKIMIIIDLNNVKVIKELKKIGFDYFKDDELNIFLIKKLN